MDDADAPYCGWHCGRSKKSPKVAPPLSRRSDSKGRVETNNLEKEDIMGPIDL
jgi:hypothetical protein